MTAASAPGVPATLLAGGVPATAQGRAPLGRATLAVVIAGLVLTTFLTWAAVGAHDGNEDRLLDQQAEEASAVLQQAVPAVTAKAEEMARVAALLQDDPEALMAELARDVGDDARFATVTITIDGAPLVAVGAPSALSEAQRRRAGAAASDAAPVTHVTGLLEGDDPRLVYSATSPEHPGVVAHAESRLDPQRVSERDGEAFEGIDSAIYLGAREDRAHLLTASTRDLPLDGRRAVRSIPIGDATLRLVVSPVGTLGGWLLRVFPWVAAAVGLLSTAAAGVLVETLHRRRHDAEAFTEELHELYRREHDIAHTLQHSLLPTHLDRLEGIEVAARYFAGAEGAEIGGDWYDVVAHEDRFTVVVGDVVGRGVKAAAVMAAMRYGTHALAGQSADPGEVLQAVNGLEHIRGDFVTMLCGTVEPGTGAIRFASAGHPAPLLIGPEDTRFLRVQAGPPIGFLEAVSYPTKRTTVAAGSVLVLFTDGLYERRGEDIEVGLERLRTAAEGLAGRPVEEILDELAGAMLGGGVRDDTAMLGFRVS